MRIKLLARFVVLAFSGATFGVFWFCTHDHPRHHISMAGFECIRDGMSLAEVENVLGGPPGDYGPATGEILSTGVTSDPFIRNPNSRMWLADSIAIVVCFDQKGHAEGREIGPVYRPYDSTLDMLCQKLGIRKKKVRPIIPIIREEW